MNTFYTKENLLFVNRVFSDYLEDNFGVVLEKIEDGAITRKLMFSFMSEINDETQGKDTKTDEKNIMLLARSKQHYMKQLQLNERNERKPNIQNLSRDKDVFGNRNVVIAEKRPEKDPYSRKNEGGEGVERVMLDRYKATRDEEVGLVKKIPDARVVASSEKDIPEPPENFNKRIRDLQLERSAPPKATLEILEGGSGTQGRMAVERERNEANSVQYVDPKALYTPSFKPMVSTVDEVLNNRQEFLIPRVTAQKTIAKYLSINSFDRNWRSDPFRYKYVVNFQNNDNDLMSKYRNIETLCVSRVIIPEEVIPSNSIINKEKTAFNYEFSFSYPYLLLSIDEFTDVYDGTNQSARRSFATLVYHKHYKAPNGRGFILLKPIQQEKKTFYPSLLSSLPKMTLSLTKPDGTLLNTSKDDYKIFKVEYEPFNPQYVKIVTNVYFDKNEFYVGDTVKLSDYVVQLSPMTQEARDLMIYINNEAGHEIKQIGSPNDNGYYKTFYIDAPGGFDSFAGRFAVATSQINALNTFNDTINWSTHIPTNGNIMNVSLQNTICMQVTTVVDDARAISQQT